MAVPYYGDFAEDDTVLIPFNTFDSNDPSASVTVTDLADADIKVHKDGGTTEIATDGATVAINFDGVTGNHLITIDTSVHADYSTGSEYAVRLEGITVDAATLNVWVGAFSIERAGGALALIKAGNLSANVVQISGDSTAADNAEAFFDGTGYAGTNNVIPTVTNVTNLHASAATAAALATAQSDLDTLTGTDGATLATSQPNYAPATAAALTTAQNDLDILTGSDGVTLATAQANYAPAKAGDNMGTVSSVTGNVDGSVGSVTGAVGSVTAEVSADVTKISGSGPAADNLEASALGIITGTAQTGTLSTTVMTSDLTGYADDELIGRVVVWTSGTAAGQASDITDYASASGTVTYTAITTAPVNADTFVIV